MKKLILAAAFAAIFSAGQAMAAEEWGIEHEKTARFEAKVVDVLCELTGNCPAQCGAGKRQLGLLTDEGKLVLAVKNQDIFAGASADLLPFCGKRLIVDGLMINDPLMTMFQIQFRKPVPDGKWRRANEFRRVWAKAHGEKWDSDMVSAWYKHDKLINDTIAKDGVFGIPGLKPKKE